MEITTPGGTLAIEELGDGLRRLKASLHPGVPGSGHTVVVTRYPVDLVRRILTVKGIGWTLDEIARDEDPSYVEATLRSSLNCYVEPETLSGARILDYGCGSGASTCILSRLCPHAEEIVGADFVPEFHRIAEARRLFYADPRCRFLLQPSPTALENVGREYDLVVLSAVVEHMLPDERSTVLPAIARLVAVGGHVLVSDTPHRYFPIEAHTTGLWFLNYQSDRAAFSRALRAANTGFLTWPDMLRAGIRGSTERAILADLNCGADSTTMRMVQPRDGRTRADWWHADLTPGRFTVLKLMSKVLLDVGEKVTGSLLTPNILACFQRLA